MSTRLQLLAKRRNIILRGLKGSASSGYGSYDHSGYGIDHSGYGHSGGGHSGYGHSGHSGFGGYSHGFGYNDCCPLVFDPLTLIAFFGFLAAGTYLLQITITMTIMGRRKKRNISEKFQDILFAGRKKKYSNAHKSYRHV